MLLARVSAVLYNFSQINGYYRYSIGIFMTAQCHCTPDSGNATGQERGGRIMYDRGTPRQRRGTHVHSEEMEIYRAAEVAH